MLISGSNSVKFAQKFRIFLKFLTLEGTLLLTILLCFLSLIIVISHSLSSFFFDGQQIAFFFNSDQSSNILSHNRFTDITERKQARPSLLYLKSCYIAESDFFSFHTIFKCKKCSILRLNQGASSQCMSNHTSCIMVVPMQFWVIASHLRKFSGRYTGIFTLQVKFIQWNGV